MEDAARTLACYADFTATEFGVKLVNTKPADLMGKIAQNSRVDTGRVGGWAAYKVVKQTRSISRAAGTRYTEKMRRG